MIINQGVIDEIAGMMSIMGGGKTELKIMFYIDTSMKYGAQLVPNLTNTMQFLNSKLSRITLYLLE